MNIQISSKIKMLSFLMTCLIVFYHCPILDNSYSVGQLDSVINLWISHISEKSGILAMSYFFTITGYLLFREYSLQEYPAKIKRRIYSLLIPYVMWQCLISIIDVFQKQYSFSFIDFLNRTFFCVRWPQDGALWYVYAVFLMALMSPVLFMIIKKQKSGWLITILLIIFFEISKHTTIPIITDIINYGYLGNIRNYIPSYLVGCILGKFSNEKDSAGDIKYVLLILVISLAFDGVLPGFFECISIQLLPIMMLYFIPTKDILGNCKVYSLTFLIYAIHQPLIGDIYPMIRKVLYAAISMPISLYNILTPIIIIIIAIIIAAFLHAIFIRVSPKFLGALTGGRF